MFNWLLGPLVGTSFVSTSVIMSILLLVACHNLGDFAFQSQWMAMEKGKNWEVLGYHVLVYTIMFVPLAFLFPKMNLAAVLVIFGSHFVIDACKARWNILKQIWQDQLCHYGVLGFLLLTGWI